MPMADTTRLHEEAASGPDSGAGASVPARGLRPTPGPTLIEYVTEGWPPFFGNSELGCSEEEAWAEYSCPRPGPLPTPGPTPLEYESGGWPSLSEIFPFRWWRRLLAARR